MTDLGYFDLFGAVLGALFIIFFGPKCYMLRLGDIVFGAQICIFFARAGRDGVPGVQASERQRYTVE